MGCALISHYVGPIDWKDKLAIWGVALTFWTSVVSAFIVALNARAQLLWTRDMERLKVVLGLQFPSYREAMAGVVRYYDTLSRLQNGHFVNSLCDEAETEMKKAWGTIYFLPTTFQNAWWKYWIHARYLKESCQQWEGDAKSQIDFWKGDLNGVQLGKLLEKLGESMRDAVDFK